ncbi:MAG: hypothetical protein AAB553_07540 [Patescibacteria group bacterium]
MWLQNQHQYDLAAALYGIRFSGKDARTERISFQTLTSFHQKFSTAVLFDEHIHITTVPPEELVYEGGSPHTENNNFWLRAIGDKEDPRWLIMPQKRSLGTYFEDSDLIEEDKLSSLHDATAFHLFNFATFPRELQDLLTEAAQHEYAWRKRLQQRMVAGEHIGRGSHLHSDSSTLGDSFVVNKVLLLPGEGVDSEDPFSTASLNGKKIHTVGINKIDGLSGMEGYLSLLVDLVSHTEVSSEERLAFILEKFLATNVARYEDLPDVVNCLGMLPRFTADVLNFNTRHRTFNEGQGRNVTQLEVEQFISDSLLGIVRVANKIRGVYGLAA